MRKYDFNDSWSEYPDGQPEKRKQVFLPHDAMLEESRIPKLIEGAASGYFPGGKYIYEKVFQPDQSWADQTIMLEFEGIYQKSSVFLNGIKIGGWTYGYTGFTVDLTEHLIFGQENRLRVEADNSQTPNARWYSGSGIYRPVSLLMGGKNHILPDGIRITTCSWEPAVIALDIRTSEDDTLADRVSFEICRQGQIVAEGTGLHSVLEIYDAKLWSAECPNLYELHVRLGDEDQAETVFGIRKLEWNGRNGLTCNGKVVKLKGACIHHDNGPLGACEFAEAAYRRIRILKKVGYNAIRSAHNPVSKELLRACDELGMYVMDEIFDMWLVSKNTYDYALYFEQEWKKDTAAMIAKDYNHPSVILYSVGNEISDIGSRYAETIQRDMIGLIRELDQTRPITNAINILAAMSKPSDKKKPVPRQSAEDEVDPKRQQTFGSMVGSKLLNNIVTVFPKLIASVKAEQADNNLRAYMESEDIVGLNYGDLIMEDLHGRNPEYLLLNTETFPKSIGKNWPVIENLDCFVGDFMWTGWDYLGEAGIGVATYGKTPGRFNKPYPCIAAGIGSVDMTGCIESQGYYAAVVWGTYKKPYIGVRPVNHSGEKTRMGQWRGTDVVHSWSWPGCEGKIAEVHVFSQGKEVELCLNGVPLERQSVTDYMAKFEFPYAPGLLTAISYDGNGNEIAQSELKTAGTETKLTVELEKTLLVANGEDLAYIHVAVTDQEGIVKNLEEKKIYAKIDGPGILQGVGSGAPITEESYLASGFTTYRGRMLIVIRSTLEEGRIWLTVSAEGIESQEVYLSTRRL